MEHTNNELKNLRTHSHPFQIQFWGSFRDDEFLYYLLDFGEGGELFELLSLKKVTFVELQQTKMSLTYPRWQKFSDTVAKFYAAELLLAIEFLHSHKIVYRGLKPEDILLDRFGHIKLVDFGFAKEIQDRTFTLCGTPEYMAPEQISKPHSTMLAVDW